jgi:hypothetical protein
MDFILSIGRGSLIRIHTIDLYVISNDTLLSKIIHLYNIYINILSKEKVCKLYFLWNV